MEKFAENCKISQKFEVSRQILDKIGVELCDNIYCLKEILISFHMIFISRQNVVWFLSYVIYFKVFNIWISPRKSYSTLLNLYGLQITNPNSKYKLKNPKRKKCETNIQKKQKQKMKN